MFGSFRELKKLGYRKLRYFLSRRPPPRYSDLAGKTVVILGSAPVSTKPSGFDESYKVITINGSQASLNAWDRTVPDVTLIQFNQIEGTNTNALEVRRVLTHQRTDRLYVLLWREGLPRLERGLKSFDYTYGKLEIVDRYQRISLMEAVSKIRNFELDADTKCSNGVIAALFALHSGAKAVILSGINPDSAGHVYNNVNLSRMHVSKDKEMLQALLRQGYPLFTADPSVAQGTGLPLWQG